MSHTARCGPVSPSIVDAGMRSVRGLSGELGSFLPLVESVDVCTRLNGSVASDSGLDRGCDVRSHPPILRVVWHAPGDQSARRTPACRALCSPAGEPSWTSTLATLRPASRCPAVKSTAARSWPDEPARADTSQRLPLRLGLTPRGSRTARADGARAVGSSRTPRTSRTRRTS